MAWRPTIRDLSAPTTRPLTVPLGVDAVGSRRAAGRNGSVVTVVASLLVRDLLSGPVRPASLVAAGPAATYLDVGGRLLAIVQPGGVRLPCAAVLTREGWSLGAAGPPAEAGFAVGEGAVHRPGGPALVVSRWFDPRVRLGAIDPEALGGLAAAVRVRSRPDALLPEDAAERLGDQLGRGAAHAAAARLLGRGTGLTPAGDDLVAGALAALRAAGSTAAEGLGAAVRCLAPVRTTRLSAALLEAADLGAVVPEAAAVLRALAAGIPGRDRRTGSLEAATDRLVGVGHTSGWHLAAGLLVGLTHARRTAAVPPGPAAASAEATAGGVVRSRR